MMQFRDAKVGKEVWLYAFPSDLTPAGQLYVIYDGKIPTADRLIWGRIVSWGMDGDSDVFAILIESSQRIVFRNGDEVWSSHELASEGEPK